MRGNRIRLLLLPLLLAAGLGACASNGVQPGIVNTSSAPSAARRLSGKRAYAASQWPVRPARLPRAATPIRRLRAGEAGRVVSIREVGLAGAAAAVAAAATAR